jgi:hypothetical protein
MKLSPVHEDLLRALVAGGALKAHRYLDGRKIYRLHSLAGPPQQVERRTVEFLKEQQLIESNKKFPAATYLLTEKGLKLAISLTNSATLPVSARVSGPNNPRPID